MNLDKNDPIEHTKTDKKRRGNLLPFILASVLFHLLLAILYLLLLLLFPPDKFATKPEEKPKYIEITEVPVPEDKETEPPKETKRLAERSHTTPEEKTRDEFTKRGSVSSLPQSKQQPQQPKRSEETTKTEKPKEEKSREESPQIVSLPEDIEELKPPKEELKEKDTPEITKEELFSSVPSGELSQEETREFLGSRDVEKKEDTVDLNTTEYRYFSYFLKLKRQIEGVWNYPEASRLRREQGELFLVFTIRSNGDLEGVNLINPSGYARLDDEAVRAIQVAAPFSPFPESWSLERLNVRAVFRYEISYGWRVQ